MRKIHIDKKNGPGGASVSKTMLPFEDFTRHLKANGFQVGLDNYLQVQALVNQLEPDCELSRLKRMLAPVFCTNQEEQQLFGELFDGYFSENLSKIILENAKFSTKTSIEYQELDTTLSSVSKKKRTAEEVEKRKQWLKLTAGIVGVLLFLIYAGNLKDLITIAIPQSGTPESIGPLRSWLSDNLSVVQAILLILVGAPIGGFLGQQIVTFFSKEKTIGLDSQRLRKPMLHWKIAVPKTNLTLFSGSAFYQATRLLKSREQSEARYLDVPKTIRASIANMGFPKLAYEFRTKFPEYLILIDKASYRDHQAIFFDQLYQSLEEQEIFAVRYYYRHQPNKCWDENNKGIDLETLFKKYHSHRLIIMGDLLELFDPMTGKLNEVLHPILLWKHKAVLTTQRAPSRIVKELNNYSNFVVLKASMDNLLSLQDAMTMAGQGEQITDGTARKLNTALEHLSEEQIIKSLRKNLDELTFQWLGICAVYPELNWPFTLYLGRQVLGEEALTENRILDLVQLPWYREGLIPEKLRSRLIKSLPEEILTKTRHEILTWLKDNPPQVEDERSQDEYEMYIAMEASMLEPENAEKKQWLQKQVRKPEQERSRYREIVLQYLEEDAKSKTAFALPAWARGLFGVENRIEMVETGPSKAESGLYLYPIPKSRNRLIAKVFDWSIIALWTIFVMYVIAILNTNSVGGKWVVYGLVIFAVYQPYFAMLLIEYYFVGFGKRIMGLMTIDVRTNKPLNLKMLGLRYADLLVYTSLYLTAAILDDSGYSIGNMMLLGLSLFGITYIAINYSSSNSKSGLGRLWIDKKTFSQVVDSADYIAGNYIGNEGLGKPEELKPEENIQQKSANIEPEVKIEPNIPLQQSNQIVEQQIQKEEPKPFKFYTEEELRAKFKEQNGEAFEQSLLIFQISKQQTWLVVLRFDIFCLLDSEKTRVNGNLIQWGHRHKVRREELYIKIKAKPNSTRTGLLDIGERRNWLYSLKLHPNAKQFEATLRSLLPLHDFEKEGDLYVEEDVVGSLKGEEYDILSNNAEQQAVEENVEEEKKIQVFISYYHKDLENKRELLRWLKPLQDEGLISIFDEENLEIGAEWDQGIGEELEKSDLFLLLVSPGYLASAYIFEKEMAAIAEKHSIGNTLDVLPIITSPCDWKSTSLFNNFTIINEQPISTRSNPNMAYTEIVEYVRAIAKGEKPPLPKTRPQTIIPPSQSTITEIKREAEKLLANGDRDRAIALVMEFSSKEELGMSKLNDEMKILFARIRRLNNLREKGVQSKESLFNMNQKIDQEFLHLLDEYLAPPPA